MLQPGIAELQKRLGYGFRNEATLLEALTHRSFRHERPGEAETHNERLEFMGDSVLGLVVAEYLYGIEARFTEAEMSRIKAHMVKRRVLAELAEGLSLGECLRVGKGEEGTGGRKKGSILANAMEAVFGAVFEDGGYEKSREVVLRLLKDKLDEALTSGEFADYKSELQELCQTRFGSLPDYRLVSEEGAQHEKLFTFEVFMDGRLFGRGSGTTKKDAQARAALEALGKLENSTAS